MNSNSNIYRGILFAVLATIIWSGNFVVARGVIKEIPPISLAFYRWMTATIIIAPFAFRQFKVERATVVANWKYLLWISLFGITIYNTLIYVAANYLPAVNLALIGTTSSPVMSIILAAIFLKEALTVSRIAGVVLCLIGILLLLSQGSWEKLVNFHFSPGDWWILLAALSFAIYNIMVRRKPAGISPVNFLFVTFLIGTILLLPAFLVEHNTTSQIVDWDLPLILVIGYLGIGNSILSFLFWNSAIQKLGAGRTALFGNLIPIFSSIEAVLILGEEIGVLHLISGLLVIGGLVLANIRKQKPVTPTKS
ncbi:MAG: DMT family transporter [Chitinophagaceae bacterium]|nr:DMT family transporter [Chitinophagaceae bacterium]